MTALDDAFDAGDAPHAEVAVLGLEGRAGDQDLAAEGHACARRWREWEARFRPRRVVDFYTGSVPKRTIPSPTAALPTDSAKAPARAAAPTAATGTSPACNHMNVSRLAADGGLVERWEWRDETGSLVHHSLKHILKALWTCDAAPDSAAPAPRAIGSRPWGQPAWSRTAARSRRERREREPRAS